MTIYTIGHSTHEWEEFIEILQAYGVDFMVDVRSLPGSDYVPQFNKENLEKKLPDAGVGYKHLPELGGRRKGVDSSQNDGWRNKSFRAYADYMQTEGFAVGLEKLLAYAEDHTVVVMCAEAVPWRCHRSMIGDALLVRGYEVKDIFSSKKAKPEVITSFAEVEGTDITYPQKNVSE